MKRLKKALPLVFIVVSVILFALIAFNMAFLHIPASAASNAGIIKVNEGTLAFYCGNSNYNYTQNVQVTTSADGSKATITVSKGSINTKSAAIITFFNISRKGIGESSFKQWDPSGYGEMEDTIAVVVGYSQGSFKNQTLDKCISGLEKSVSEVSAGEINYTAQHRVSDLLAHSDNGTASKDINLEGGYQYKMQIKVLYACGELLANTKGVVEAETNVFDYAYDTEPPQVSLMDSNGRVVSSEDGITNGDVTVTYTDNNSGPKGRYGVAADTYPANFSVTTSFNSGYTFSSEGKYKIIVTDIAANTTIATFTIDKTAPTGSLTGVTDGGYTKTDVTFSWTDSEATATLNGAAYSSGQLISKEQKSTIVLTDRAGNSTSYSFTIDKTAPNINMSIADGVHTNNNVVVEYSDDTEVIASYDRIENSDHVATGERFASGHRFTDEGNYTVTVKDAAGNSASRTFTIDKSAPVIAAYEQYTNKRFTFTAKDTYGSVAVWEYRLNDGEIKCESTSTLTIGGTAESNGIWLIRVSDELNNASGWIKVTYVYRDTFGNLKKIYNSFVVPSYFVVTLSQKNYAGHNGSYTFSEYSYALKFAKSKEWECRVIEVDGSSWNYVTPNNENARMIYKNREELESVIEKYAVKNISERKVLGPSGTVLNNPTGSDMTTAPSALTVQLDEFPSLLSAQYAGYKYMLAQDNYVLERPSGIAEGNKSICSIKYISDGISLREDSERPVEYGEPLKSVCQDEGWYLITESDTCGNIEKYLIFVDLQHPTLMAQTISGNDMREIVNIDEDYVNGHSQTMRFIEFSVSSLTDNMDKFSFIAIDGRNSSNVRYVDTDEIPVLNYENGYYGAYTITVYDRSCNTLSFVIYIAGEAPTIKNSSLTNETAVTFTVQINDSYNGLTDIKFFKILFDGTEEKIYTDSFGTEVNTQNLVYRMNVGGKYVFEITDLYGRIVRTSPLFYMKGLPQATFRGVKDGGLTKNDVSILFDKENTLVLYTYQNGEWESTDRYEYSEGLSQNTINIQANSETTALYKVLLYVTADRNLFTEYFFEIDGILPIIEIKTVSNSNVESGTVITEDFYLTWSESGYTAYYKKQGAISNEKYEKDKVINSAGNYEFTVYDRANNIIVVTVTLDNTVSNTLEGTYILAEDGSYITRGYFRLTINEPFSVFNVYASNGIEVKNGQKLDVDGTYSYHVEDLYGNVFEIKLTVDKLPPLPIITTSSGKSLENGARTREPFNVSCSETGASITYSYNNSNRAVYDGRNFEEAGTYVFTLSDIVGNSVSISITIDLTVNYRIDGNFIEYNDAYCTKYRITISISEELSKCLINDNNSEASTEIVISEEGTYNVLLVDLAENEERFTVIVDKTPPKCAVTVEGEVLEDNFITNKPFVVSCDEADAIIEYIFNNTENAYDGRELSEIGVYAFSVSDRLGNMSEFTVEINQGVSYRIEGEYLRQGNEYWSKSWLRIVVNEETKAFEISSLSDPNQRISQEGTYSVYICDLAGNEERFTVIIDKTPPSIRIETESGKVLTSGAVTNEAFKIICDEEGAGITYGRNGAKDLSVYSKEYLSDEGKYTIIATDKLGTYAEHEIIIDKSVAIKINGSYITEAENVYVSRNWLSVTATEDLTTLSIKSADGKVFDSGSRIANEGKYECVAIDTLGNEVHFTLKIDKTPPVLMLSGVSDGGMTNDIVSASAEDFEKLFYRYNSGEKTVGHNGISFEAEGAYIVTAEDKVGNIASASFKIDKHVDVKPNINIVDGQLVTQYVSFTFEEEIKAKLVHNGETREYLKGNIADIGSYYFEAVDSCGNVASFTWEILPAIAKEYSITIPDGYNVVCELNGNLYDGEISNNKLLLTISGDYSLLFVRSTSNFELKVTVDSIPPTIEIKTTRKSVILSNPNKDNIKYTLYYNGQQKSSFNIKSSVELTDIGSYRLICEDSVGNVTEYTFELNYLSDVSIALICVVSALVISGIIAIIVYRFKRRIY